MEYIDEAVDKVVELAMNQYPWDAGYRIDFYRTLAAEIVEMADSLEEEIHGRD